MNIERLDVLSAYLLIIEKESKALVDKLAKLGLVTINNPTPEERDKLLTWLNENPFIVNSYHDNKVERLCVPLYSNYMENDRGITINRTDSVLFDQLKEILQTYEIPQMYLKRKFSARIIANMVLNRTETSILTFEELRNVLSVKKTNYVSFQQFERVFESVNNDLKENGYELIYSRLSPDPRSSDIVLELLKHRDNN